MIYKLNFKILTIVTTFAFYSGAIPYHFVKRYGNLQIITASSTFRHYFVRATTTVIFFYVTFLGFRIGQIVLIAERKKDYSRYLAYLVTMAYQFCAYSLALVNQMNTLRRWNDIPAFISQYICFFRSFQGHYLQPTARHSRSVKFFISMMVIGCHVVLQNFKLLRKKPQLPHFLTSVIKTPQGPEGIGLTLANIWIWAILWSNFWTYAFYQYLYITCAVLVIRELDLRLKSPCTYYKLRQPDTCLKLLRSIHVLHRFWQVAYEDFFPYSKATVVTIATLALYGVIRLTGSRAYIMGFTVIVCGMYLGIFYFKLGLIEHVSKVTIHNWRNASGSTKYMKKLTISIPAVIINVGSFYRVTKITVFTIFWTVLNNTITLLLL